MTRVEFKLFMPSRNTWNGEWSGDKQNCTITRTVDEEEATKLDKQSWSYSWSDGWRAEIRARIVRVGEMLKASHGFHGYEWMIESILKHGKIYASHEEPSTREIR
jgi:hypothetical protein